MLSDRGATTLVIQNVAPCNGAHEGQVWLRPRRPRRATGPTAFAHLVDVLEELRFDSLWLSERVTGGWLDPLSALAFAAGRTRRLKLGTSTLVVPGRNRCCWPGNWRASTCSAVGGSCRRSASAGRSGRAPGVRGTADERGAGSTRRCR